MHLPFLSLWESLVCTIFALSAASTTMFVVGLFVPLNTFMLVFVGMTIAFLAYDFSKHYLIGDY